MSYQSRLVIRARLPVVFLASGIVVGVFGACGAAHSEEVGAGIRVGTLGIGADLDFGLMNRLSARIGYSALNVNRTVTSSDVTYDGTLKLSTPSAILDWYAFGGGFRLSLGAVQSGTKIDATARPVAGVITLNGTQYNSSQLGSLTGEFKFGNSVSPYVGLGYGNPVGTGHRVTFLFDLGAIYGGTPKIALNPVCAAPAGSAICTQLASDTAVEQQNLVNRVDLLKWYPVVSMGLAYRF